MQQSTDSGESSANSHREPVTTLPEELAEILRLISKAEPLDALLDKIACVIVSHFGIKSLTICLYDDESGFFKPVLIHGFAENQAAAIGEHAYTLERKKDELDEKFRVSRDCYYVRAEQLTSLYNDDVDYLNDLPEDHAANESGNWHDLDYIDLLMRDRLGNLIGWIEIDEPLNRQELPPIVLEEIRIISDLAAIAVENSRMSDAAIAAVNECQGHLDLIVHDIGNLITPLVHYLESARNDMASKGGVSSNLDKAHAIAKDAETLVRNVRKFTEASQSSTSIGQSFDLKQVLVKCIATIRTDFPEKEVVIDFDFPSEECTVIADELIADLFSNILGNAVKYSPGDVADIDVTISNSHDSWIVRIDDHGIGIPDDRKEVVFSRFAKRPGEANGSGLGLSIVSLLVDRYNGLIALKDRVPGHHTLGASFEVALPKARDGSAQ